MKCSLILATVLLTGAVSFAAKDKSVIVPLSEVKFMPLDPKQPDGIQVGSANGNVMSESGVFYMKLKQGTSPMHSHTNAYHGANVKGVVKHWVTGDEASAPELPEGSYWYQPGKQVHGDKCVSADGCIILLNFAGKFDFVPAKK